MPYASRKIHAMQHISVLESTLLLPMSVLPPVNDCGMGRDLLVLQGVFVAG